MKLTMAEYGQLNNYATAITSHPQVAANANVWDFWLVGTDVDDAIKNLWNDPNRPGLVFNGPLHRLWVVTWAMLLDQSNRRLAAFRNQLEIEPTEQTGRAYLQRVHAEFIPPEPARVQLTIEIRALSAPRVATGAAALPNGA
jgi:hypothetical protein